MEVKNVKVAITCTGQSLTDELDQRFGRADYFLVIDSVSFEYTVINNAARTASGGAGIAAAQSIIDHQVEAVITGQLGPNALNVLSDAGIAMYQGSAGSAYQNLIAFNQQKLPPITSSGPAHAGMGGGRNPGNPS